MEFEKKVVELDVNDVLPNRFQPRIKFNEDSINELSESIKEHGVIQPIVVRAMGDKYEIIAGERRYKASLLAGKSTIPAVVTNLNDKDSAEVALIENVQRKDLTPIEEAISYKKILDMGYLTQEELATKLGKTQSTVANKLRLLNLDEEVQEAVLEEKISERHARSLLKLSDLEEQRKMLANIINNRLTVRKTDEEINKILHPEVEEKVKVSGNPFLINPIEKEKLPVIEKSDVIKETKRIDEPIVILDEIDQIPAVQEDEITIDPITDMTSSPVDDSIIGGLNIPSSPIEDSDFNPLIKEEPKINVDEKMNPGFMNIQSIEDNAKDIEAPQKPEVDINSLLKPTIMSDDISDNVELEPVKVEAPQEEIKVGKFFSLPVEDEEEKREQAAQSTTTDAFNFELNMVDVPTVNPVQQQNDVEDLSASDPIDLNSMLEPANSPLPSSEESFKIEPMVNLEEHVDTIELDSLGSLQEEPEELSLDDSISFSDSNISASMPNEEIQVEIPVMSSEDMPVPSLYQGPEINKDINGAITNVRKVLNELENRNYVIDSEELDFDNEYQIIIKIQK